jgi:hypothetical protein
MNNLELVSNGAVDFYNHDGAAYIKSTINAPRLRKIICFPRLAIEFIIAN